MARYRVLIETIEEKPSTEKKWVVLSDKGGDGGGAKYGYAPPDGSVRNERITVLEQNLDKIDVAAVIKAINGIK